MDRLNKWYLKLQEYQKGQTMAEYGLILAVVAVVALVGYKLLGTDISSLATTVAGDL
jgi:Flp pilus assembly pilin Flp